MFLNPIASPFDEPIYRPTNHYKIYDHLLFLLVCLLDIHRVFFLIRFDVLFLNLSIVY